MEAWSVGFSKTHSFNRTVIGQLFVDRFGPRPRFRFRSASRCVAVAEVSFAPSGVCSSSNLSVICRFAGLRQVAHSTTPEYLRSRSANLEYASRSLRLACQVLMVQIVSSPLHAPLSLLWTRRLEGLGQRVSRLTIRRAKNNQRPQRDTMLRLARTDEAFQCLSVLRRDHQGRAARPHAAVYHPPKSDCHAMRETLQWESVAKVDI